MTRFALVVTIFGPLAACAPSPVTEDGFLVEVPPEVLERAAPGQNLDAVAFLEEDRCFWYQYTGPVETTLLPLRGKSGGHLCAPEEVASDDAA